MTRAFVLDVLERLGKTFVQAFAAALVIAWGGSGLDIADLTNTSTWAKILTPAVLAGLAAVGSLVTSLLSGLKTNTASASTLVAQTAVLPPAPHVPEHAVTPADPNQPAAGVPANPVIVPANPDAPANTA